MEVTGTAVTYNREATMPAATFYDVGDTWTEATPTFTQVTTALRIMGGDADVDNFLQATYADPNDIEAEVSDAMSGRLRRRDPPKRAMGVTVPLAHLDTRLVFISEADQRPALWTRRTDAVGSARETLLPCARA